MPSDRETSEMAGRELRRARRVVRLSLEMLNEPGPAVRLSVLTQLTGLSRDKLIDDEARGELRCVRVRAGLYWYRYVERGEAMRYLGSLGLVPRGTIAPIA